MTGADSLAQTVRKVRHVLCNCECRSAQTGFEALRELDELVGQFEEVKQRLTQAERERDERTERLTLSNDRFRNDARDPDVASIEEAFLYVAPVHASVVRDGRAALRRIVEEIDKWHRDALDWQAACEESQASEADLLSENAALRDKLREANDLFAAMQHGITLASSGPAPEGTIRRRPCSSHCWQEGECDGSCGRNPKEAG